LAEYKLHGFSVSGNCYKVALMLAACAADWEPVQIRRSDMRDPAWRARVNPTGEAPVLEHKGKFIRQSPIILDYLAETLGQHGWASETERREIQTWMFFDNHKFTGPLSSARFRRVILKIDDAATKDYQDRFDLSLGIIEQRLGQHPWIALDRLTIADFSYAGYLFYDPGELALDWSKVPNLDAWRGRIRALPGFKDPLEMLPPIAA
jgi:glutathione S-transferase